MSEQRVPYSNALRPPYPQDPAVLKRLHVANLLGVVSLLRVVICYRDDECHFRGF